MNNFWDKLNQPIPFYTVGNIGDTIAFVKEHPDTKYAEIFRSALEWVRSVLEKKPEIFGSLDGRFLLAARESAEKEHDRAIFEKDYAAAVRWRYVMAAVSDYIRRAAAIGEE